MVTLSMLAGLFAVAFLAATVLPLQSEAVLAGLMATTTLPWPVLLAVASLGNTLGAAVNWAMGRGLATWQGSRWFPATPQQMARAQSLYDRWGALTLLLAWVPVIGDALTVMSGAMGERLWRFLLLVGIGKTARYLVLAAGLAGVL